VHKEMIFDISSLVKDQASLEEIEFWGHDAGEFVAQEPKPSPEENKDQTELKIS
jgi:hypothetical protein